MNSIITDNMDVVMYVVKVNGVEKSLRFRDRIQAERALNELPDELRLLAEIQSVTMDGKQLLLG